MSNLSNIDLVSLLLTRIIKEETESLNFVIPKIFANKISAYMSMREDFIFNILTAQKLIELLTDRQGKIDVEAKKIYIPALWTSIVISYSRNFTDATKAKNPKLEIKECFTEDTQYLFEVHNYLIDIRNNYIAHRGINNVELAVVFLKLPKTDPLPKETNYRIKSVRSLNPTKDRLISCIELFLHLQKIVEVKLQNQTKKVHASFLKEFTPQQMLAFQIK